MSSTSVKNVSRKHFRRCAIALAIAGVSPGIWAQTQQTTLEEVIVTAQKREQSLQDVPVAVTAVRGEVLESLGITQVAQLEQMSPSLVISGGSKKTNSGVQIRGIGTNGIFGVQVEPAVLVVFDDVSQAQGGQAFTNLIDIERIEVLRGPQNTLFGKNASAGVLNIVTSAPTAEFEGLVELTASDDEEYAVSGSVSGPLTDTLGYRLTGYYSDRDGFIENIHNGVDLHGQEEVSVRGKLRWEPSEDWDITLSGHYSNIEQECCSLVVQSYSEDAAFLAPSPTSILYKDAVPDIAQDEENDKVDQDDQLSQDTTSQGGSLKINYFMNDFTVTSITAYNDWDNEAASDIDLTSRDVDTDLAGLFSIRTWDNGLRESEFFSQELRLLSPVGDRFDYILGMYYSKAKNTELFRRDSQIEPFRAHSFQDTETETIAVFGQGTFHLGDNTDLTLGLRYNDEDISADVTNYLEDTRIKSSDSDSVPLGMLSVHHTLQDDHMLYLSIAQGYKGRAFDSAGFDEVKAANPVEPEKSINYEIGYKSNWLDNRLQLNAALFYTTYDDFQAQNFVVIDGAIGTQLLNVGELESKGIEVEGVGLIGDNLRLNFGVAYINAEVKEWDNGPCYAHQTLEEGCIPTEVSPGVITEVQPSLAGNKLQNAPEWKFNVGGDYRLELTNQPFYGFLSFNYMWRDETTYDIKGSPYAYQGSFGVANLNLGIAETTSERYRVTLFVNNLFDEFHSAAVTDEYGQLYTDTFITRIPTRSEQRYAGVRLRFAF